MIALKTLIHKVYRRTNKWTYIILFLLAIIITITVLLLRIESYKNKTDKLSSEIENLKLTNTMLYKENIFKQEQIRLINTFSNSTIQISKLSNRKLNTDEKNIISSINSDFYNFMRKYKADTNTTQ